MIRLVGILMLALFALGFLAGCDGPQVVKAPPTRPSNVNMSRGTAAGTNTPTQNANQ